MTRACDLRPSLTAYLGQRLDAFRDGFRHNLAILGSARSGKSYLVEEALRRADASFIAIRCGLNRMSIQEFARRFSSSVLRGALHETGPASSLDELLARSASLAPKTSEAVQQLTRYLTGHAPADLFNHTLDLVPLVHHELQRPCVLVLDEFLHLGELGVAHAFREIGKRVVTWPHTVFLVTSSSTAQARDILRERLQLLFGQFELLNLGALEAPAVSACIQRELPGLDARSELPRFLLSWVGDCPWYLQVLTKRMKEVALLSRQSQITEATLIQASSDVLGDRDGVLYQWCVMKIEKLLAHRHGPLARESLVAIAKGARTTRSIGQLCGARRSLSPALQLLVEQGLAERRGACWVIPDPVFGFWLGAMGDATQPSGLMVSPEAIHRFRQALSLVWLRWQQLAHTSLAERIRELLLQFHNETVSLDHRTGRLPAFQRMNTTRPAQAEETYILAESDDDQRWCCLVHEGKLEEARIVAFDRFCHLQSPKPSRKVVVAKDGLDLNAKLLAKDANMWVWEPSDLRLLSLLYGQPSTTNGS